MNVPTDVKAIVLGLTKLDPTYYNGWDGDCPGCDIDMNNMASLLTMKKIPMVKLFNEAATLHNVKSVIKNTLANAKADDLIIFYCSGHGGQVPDLDGDEEDGKDETLCLWDGQLIDDELYEFWCDAPEGVRIFYVTDTCNSGTNFRAGPPPPRIHREYTGQLIHYGGCEDSHYSYGSGVGGNFTNALMKTFNGFKSYVQWFNDAKELVPRNQIPIYREYGRVTDRFRNGFILS